MRYVFDTNVLISALLLPDSKPRRALDLALARGKLLLSFALLAELYDVLSRRQFRRYVDEEDIRRFLDALTREALWVEPTTAIKVCRDPDDDKILDLAVSGAASFIVTGDSDLLVLHPYQGIDILSPVQFLELQLLQDCPFFEAPHRCRIIIGLPCPSLSSTGRPSSAI